MILFTGLSNAKVNLKSNKTKAYVTIVITIFMTLVSFFSVALGALDQFGIINLENLKKINM